MKEEEMKWYENEGNEIKAKQMKRKWSKWNEIEGNEMKSKEINLN